MNPNNPDWARALFLLDTATSLNATERAAFLREAQAREPSVAVLLGKLLHAHDRVETQDILATLPSLAPQPVAAAPDLTGQLVGPFLLIEPLGRGGMGSVWRARYADNRLKRDVAVKLPNNGVADASLRERFARERDFLAQLTHPNIARLYDAGVSTEGQPYLAMAYVQGQAIDVYCAEQGLSVAERLRLFLQVLAAVGHAHQHLVLHRDLKPSNILVDQTGQVQLLDFGVAKLLPNLDLPTPDNSNALTEMAGAALTLAYAAPEQINHAPLSTATDTYALAVVLFHLLTGASPYKPKRSSRGALEDAILHADPLLASTCAEHRVTQKTLRGDLDTVLLKALKKLPADRYSSTTDFATDIGHFLAQEPVSAQPDSWGYRSQRWLARNRFLATVLGVSATGLLATSGAALWQAKLATAQATLAKKEQARAASSQQFLAGLFSSADPEVNKEQSRFAGELLEQGLKNAERDLANDPETHGHILKEIGGIYKKRGDTEASLAAYRRRYERIAPLDAVDINTRVDAALDYGDALGRSNSSLRNAEALPALNAAVLLSQEAGVSPQLQVYAQSLLADQYRLEGQLDLAKAQAAQALSLARQRLPNPSPYYAAALENNATIAAEQGRLSEARQTFQELIQMDNTGQARGLLERTMSLIFVSQMEYDAGNYLAAHRLALQASDLAKRELGDTSTNLAPARRLVVLSLALAGEQAQAQRFIAELFAEELGAVDASRRGKALYILAIAALQAQQYPTALQHLQLATDLLKHNPVWHERTRYVAIELALRQGDNTLAAILSAELVSALRSRYAPNRKELALGQYWQALSFARNGRVVEARQSLTTACDNLQAVLAPLHPLLTRCEAYRALLDPSNNNAAVAAVLGELLKQLNHTQTSPLPLKASLLSVMQQLQQNPHQALLANRFPLLL
jgi:eukaryotic-like serine/threonine-protein kinase